MYESFVTREGIARFKKMQSVPYHTECTANHGLDAATSPFPSTEQKVVSTFPKFRNRSLHVSNSQWTSIPEHDPALQSRARHHQCQTAHPRGELSLNIAH